MENLVDKSIYFSLQMTGNLLCKTTAIGNHIAERIEPIAVNAISKMPLSSLKKYLKTFPDPRLKIESTILTKKSSSFTITSNNKEQDPATVVEDKYEESPKQLYQIRNEVIQIAAMGIYSLPFTAKFFDYITPTLSKRKAVENEDLKSYHIYSSGVVSEKLCFSFAGSSWLFFYEVGVAIALQEFIQARAFQDCLFMGVSTGSFVAACLALDLPLSKIRPFLVSSICKMSRRFFGPIGQCSKMWTEILDEIIMDNVDLANDRLYITLTKLPSMETKVQSNFKNKKVIFS